MQLFAPVPDPYYKYTDPKDVNPYIQVMPSNYRVVTEAEEGLPGVEGQNVFSTNNVGFRGDHMTIPKPENEFRIFLMGASITESYYIDDSKSINSVMQRELNRHVPDGMSIKVYNAGHSGYKSDDLISILVHRILHLKPDMIVLLGPNDLYAGINNYDYLHFLKETPKKKIPLVHFLATEFQIPRRLYYILEKMRPSDREVFETVSARSGYKKMAERARAVPESDHEPRIDLESFKINLKTIISAAQANNVKVVIAIAQTTWNSDVDPEIKNWHWSTYSVNEKIRYREDLMIKAQQAYDDVTRQLAVEYRVPVLDFTKIIPKSREYFYDDGHFNVKGAEFAGKKLSSFILQDGLISH